MGIYIKGMKMPTLYRTYKVRFSESGDEKIIVGIANENSTAYRPIGEVISVPPHGRLIDVDALMEILSKVIDINAAIEQRNEATEQERRCLWWFEQQIGIAPTIIPAEGNLHSNSGNANNSEVIANSTAEEGE